MTKLRFLFGVLAVVLIAGGGLLGDDKNGAPPAKLKGFLPMNWGKLGLSEEQKQKVYGVQAKYRDKIGDLEKQISDMKKQQQTDMEAVLSDAQKARLREILTGKAPADTPKEEKK